MLGGMISICFTSLQKSINVIRYLQGKKISMSGTGTTDNKYVTVERVGTY